MQTVEIPIQELRLSEYNPRRISAYDFEALKRSIREFGFVEPVVINTFPGRENVVIGGHQRVRAAKVLGLSMIPAVQVHLPLTKEKLLNLALNRISGTWDEQKLTALIEEVIQTPEGDLALSGFTEAELDRFIQEVKVDPFLESEDRIPEKPTDPPNSKPGELYELGSHRLLCGDCTNEEQLNRLLDGSSMDILVTSPPYNVGIKYSRYQDDLDFGEYMRFVERFLRNTLKVMKPGRVLCLNVCHNRKRDVPAYYSVLLESLGLRFLDCIIWEKPSAIGPQHGVTIQSPYPRYYYPNMIYEVVLVYASRETPTQEQQQLPFEVDWLHETLLVYSNGKLDQQREGVKPIPKQILKQFRGDIWRVPPKSSPLHPAIFPAEIPRNCIEFYTRHGERVLDPFGGSGTTLIAAEKSGRVAYLMEMDPAYCDVTRDRYAQFVKEPKWAAHPERVQV